MNREVQEKCRMAREASPALAACSTDEKNRLLQGIAGLLLENRSYILEANRADLENLQGKPGYSRAMYDRLLLTDRRIEDMAGGLLEIVALEDPVGEVTRMWRRPNGLQIGLRRVPIGVIAIIYEARPNVTVDAAGLALKAGNAIVLRGSSEALHSNTALVSLMEKALAENNLPPGSVSLIRDCSREAAADLMKADQYLDLLIPRGGASLIRAVVENSTVPVIQTGKGNCHVYIDESADPGMAEAITVNAKTQRPGVCNAAETLLVHSSAAKSILPPLLDTLKSKGVEIRGCQRTVGLHPGMTLATGEDWEREYLDLVLAVKIVDSIEEAVAHINRYGTGHSEAIVTADYAGSNYFMDHVDAAAVYVNASTRFTDGGQFGLGAEMGISTQKLHVRGPMGLQALTSAKYIVYGSGQIRE